MKEQLSTSENNIDLTILEEGLYREKQKCRMEYKTNCCMRCIPYLRLIFLLEVTLFFGWGCYMILQPYFSQITENRATSNARIVISLERYSPMVESLSEIQESRPSTEMPAILDKPEVILDKINSLIEDMKFTRDQNLMRNKEIVMDLPDLASMVQTSTQNSNANVLINNIMRKSDINRLLTILSSGTPVHNEKFMENKVFSVPEKFPLTESIDGNINADKERKPLRHEQFLKKLRNISKIEATNDVEQFENRNGFTENVDHLTLNDQENHALGASDKSERLEFNVATSSSLEDFVDHTISADLTNISGDLKKEFLLDTTDKPQNAHLELDLVICPPYESHESSDMPVKVPTESSFTSSQPVLAQEISEQVENGSSDDIDERGGDKHDVNDSDMSMSVSASRSQDYISFATATMQNTEEQHSSESISMLTEDKSMENIKNLHSLRFLKKTMRDSAELWTSHFKKFLWFNLPPRFADSEYISERENISETTDRNTYEEKVDDVIPGSQCEITIQVGILIVKCPAIKFDEKWNFTSTEIPPTDIPKIANFRDIFDDLLRTECDEDASEQLGVENISNKNSDKEVTSRDSLIAKRIHTIELQESTTSAAKISNDVLPDLSDTALDSSESGVILDDYDSFYDNIFYDSSEEEEEQVTTVSPSISDFGSSTVDLNKERNPLVDISGKEQQEQLKITEEQDYSISDNTGTSLKNFEHFYGLAKNLNSLLKNEISNIMTRYLPKSSRENYYRNNICGAFRYMRSIPQHSWNEQYIALMNILDYIQNSGYSHSTGDHKTPKEAND